MPLTRWQHLTQIVMPALPVLWKMSARGLRVDTARVRHHEQRLRNEKIAAARAVLECPPVAAALSAEINQAERRVLTLRGVVAHAFNEANRERTRYDRKVEAIRAARANGDRSVTLKSLGRRPPLQRVPAALQANLKDAEKAALRIRNFNPGSSQQKAWLLYDLLKLPRQTAAGTGNITTDKGALKKLVALKETPAELRPALRAMLQYEHLDQMLGTFIKPALREDGSVAPRIYYEIGAHRTATGRLASGSDTVDKGTGASDINSQNQPKEIRDIYIADEGHYFIQADWSRVEWLLTLLFAGDMESFERAIAGEDQHRRLASVIFGVPLDAVTPDQRTTAKRATHGINYGMGAGKLAAEMQVSFTFAKAVITSYKAAFPLVAAWREETIARAKKQRYLQTVYGWRRWFWEDNPTEMVAFLPQATGADMCKIMLPRVDALAEKLGGVLAATTHDSFLLQVPERVPAADAAAALTAVMTQPFSMLNSTSFPCDIKTGLNWKECS